MSNITVVASTNRPAIVSLGVQVLAMLGQSRIANNLNQLAKAANLGTLEPLAKKVFTPVRGDRRTGAGRILMRDPNSVRGNAGIRFRCTRIARTQQRSGISEQY
ncbi:plasmid mobilization relaxosome protein MobC [uncultured Roseobacter sp.]|uniref:plasmid mobilization relaxosome protein MobC n=1 Tax=uncultured Roseobacter sp. TaxID=114847 RepID=UPI00260367DB|nr:plasmid mobilization relaxosome protein MobC [uncultured Roseobacter sp.]